MDSLTSNDGCELAHQAVSATVRAREHSKDGSLARSEASDDFSRPRILFVVTEDWFFVSHFLPLIAAAVAAGLNPIIVTHVNRHAECIERAGGRVIALPTNRKTTSPIALVSEVRKLAAIFAAERPLIVHCISLRSILVGGIAARLGKIPQTVYAITGLGTFGARRDALGRLFRICAGIAIRGPLAGINTHFVFENSSDPTLVGLKVASPQVTVVGGAGVDPTEYPPAPFPISPTLKIAIVARMVWSKGIEDAVQAVSLARRWGAPVTLSLFGEPDDSNPRAISRAQLSQWSKQDGICWRGKTESVTSVWANHDVACLLSKGGEGLPRSLLEAASCGRPILTTDVPGCRDFVRSGKDGFVLPAGDVEAAARAITQLANDRHLVQRLGASAHGRVHAGYTKKHFTDAMTSMYANILMDLS